MEKEKDMVAEALGGGSLCNNCNTFSTLIMRQKHIATWHHLNRKSQTLFEEPTSSPETFKLFW